LIVILGLTIVAAAAITGVARFVGNCGSPHALTHGFPVLNGDRHPAPTTVAEADRSCSGTGPPSRTPPPHPRLLNGQPAPEGSRR